ncbi:hypothetical protein K458DRAFT_31028 [Lentithecium fluviatile CBS 122367]|uniref:Uncharacterized protein n=1 Tax=Lentithecium fluviatile CBS 122367 TaxID=1168545 RepID=A0A6G1J2K0_9PLEO|nr:hypothetical protein K458DRAFT_31028 [Lentithecium fluviatile CBS 122367]
MGKTSWALICGVIVNVIALLVISPLSAALLTSDKVVVPQTIVFKRLTPKPGAQILVNATRETYFRTMSALTRKISTSTWLSDTLLTLPFWPASEDAQLGLDLTSSHGSW